MHYLDAMLKRQHRPPAGRLRLLLICVVSTLVVSTGAHADTPDQQSLRHIILTLIQKIGSPVDTIDRAPFARHLTGELSTTPVDSLVGNWPLYVDAYIDTIIHRPDIVSSRTIRIGETDTIRTDTISRRAVYVTTYHEGEFDHYTFFCRFDSVWKIETWRQMSTADQRERLRKQLQPARRAADSSHEFDARSLLVSTDKKLAAYAREIEQDALEVAAQLQRSRRWTSIDFDRHVFDTIGEYDVLDSMLTPEAELFQQLNRGGIVRLLSHGISRIERPSVRSQFSVYPLAALSGKELGLLYTSDSTQLPPLESDSFFRFMPVASRLWFYWRVNPAGAQSINARQVRPYGPFRQSIRSQSGESTTPTKPFPTDDSDEDDKRELLNPKQR